MKNYHSNVILTSIIPFSERRNTFILFAKENNIEIMQILQGRKLRNVISKDNLKLCFEIYKKSKLKRMNFSNKRRYIDSAFLDVKEFLKGEKK